MSKLVILEGFLNQKQKNKDVAEIYAVLTSSCLKIYRSKIEYTQKPDTPSRTFEFSNNYNILPMPFEKTHMFSLFKRGEKADERLYLETATKTDYDLWLGQIDGIINKKSDLSASSTTKANVTETNPGVAMNVSITHPVTDLSPQAKSPTPRFNIRTTSPTIDAKQMQLTIDKLEADLKTQRKNANDAIFTTDELQKKLANADQKILELEKEKNVLMTNAKDTRLTTSRFNDAQLLKASSHICQGINALKINNSSYEFLVTFLCADKTQLAFLRSFLRHQLEYLIHRCSIETGSDLSLFHYLTKSITMDTDSLATFVSTFLTTLSKQMNPSPATSCDLSSNLNQIITSVVHMNSPPSKILASNKSFQQTALEIAYLLAPKSQDQSTLSNGHSDPVTVTDQFNDLIKSVSIECVDKVFVITLSNHIAEHYRSLANDRDFVDSSQHQSSEQNPVQELFLGKWNDLNKLLRKKEAEIEDLHITLRQFSEKLLELEDLERPRDDRSMDSVVNYYTSLAQHLCHTCQQKVCDQIKTPVTESIGDLVNNFTSYWRSINDMTAFLARKKNSSTDIKDALEMTKKSSQKYELLMKQFQEVSQRDLANPGCSKTVPIINGKSKTAIRGPVTQPPVPSRRPRHIK